MGWSFGSVERTDTGVTFSRKREGVEFRVSAKEIERWAARNGREMPRLIRMSAGSAANALQSQLKKLMASGGGDYGVPRFRDFTDFTRRYREVKGNTRPIGGVLVDKKRIVKYGDPVTGVQYVGWHDRMKDVAINFQDAAGGAVAEKWLASNGVRAYCHRHGISEVPRAYEHNPRPVLLPFAAHIERNLATWKRHAFEKNIAREIAKSSGWARWSEPKGVSA